MRILYLIDSLGGGGAEAVVANLVTYLKDNVPEVSYEVVTLYPTPQTYLPGKEFPFTCLSLPSKYSIQGIRRLDQLLDTGGYDIIHVHLYPANYYAALVSLRHSEIAWIYTEHNVWNRRRSYTPLRLLEAPIYSRFDRIIAVSEIVADSLRQWVPSVRTRIRTITNGVLVPDREPVRWESQLGNECPNVLFAGRLEHVKGVDVLLEAFAALPESTKLLIAGDGSQRKALEFLTSSLNLKSRVDFLGFRPDLQQLFAEVDCVVLPSRWEGLPMVALEAMAASAPVVATAVGGIPEVIQHHVTGWLVPPEDPNSLAGAIAEVLSDRQMARQVGRQARERVREYYSVESAAKKTLALYREVLDH